MMRDSSPSPDWMMGLGETDDEVIEVFERNGER